MPISEAFAESARTQRDRLRALVARLNPGQLAMRLPNGWTVAGTLAHLALWDRKPLLMMRRWAAGDMSVGEPHCDPRTYDDGDLFNDAVQPLLEMIRPERAAGAAVKAAEEIDAFLLEISDEVVAAALARSDAPNLDRGAHRKHHLDIIEKALGESA
jgi:hypothetical protein